MPHPLSLHHLCALDLDPPGLIRTARAAGFDYVCIFTRGMDESGFIFPLVTPQLLRETRAALAETGIRVNNIEVFYITPDIDIAGCRENLEIGASLGARTCSAIIGDDDPIRAADNFAALAEMGKSYGLPPAIEAMAMSACGSIDHAAELGRAAGHVDGCLAVDSLHLFRTGGSPADLARLGPSMIGSVQINDGPLIMPVDNHVFEAMTERLLPGEGEFPLRDFVANLPEDCVISVEVPNHAARAKHPDPISWATALYRSASQVITSAEGARMK